MPVSSITEPIVSSLQEASVDRQQCQQQGLLQRQLQYQRRLQRAMQRIESMQHRRTTALAREFFSGYNDEVGGNGHTFDLGCDEEHQSFNNGGSGVSGSDGVHDGPGRERWRSLPCRLAKLAAYLKEESNNSPPEFSVCISQNSLYETKRIALGAAVFAVAPPTFLNDFQCLFEALLDARQMEWKIKQRLHKRNRFNGDNDVENKEEIMDVDEDDGDDSEDEEEEDELVVKHRQILLSQETELYHSLSILGWIHPPTISQQENSQHSPQLRTPFHSSLRTITLFTIKSLISSNFETPGMFDQVLQWKSQVLDPYIIHVLGEEIYVKDRWEEQLEYAVAECFVKVRSDESFDLVTDYPDSLPAVRELSLALSALDGAGRGVTPGGAGRAWYHTLANEWQQALVQRLIHPGAQTLQIIDVYINTIKVLREIDPSGELLAVVTKPVRDYLKGRSDTVRCIITSLTEEESGGVGDLYEELRRNDARPLEEAELDEEDEEDAPTFDWVPGPSVLEKRGAITGRAVVAAGGKGMALGHSGASSRRMGDILSMLVGIYGSKELFVNEYRIMLADKLLSNLEYDTDKEVHNLELLKLRFGEASMRQCEVMIKDIDDSKRIHTNIRSTLESNPHKDGEDNIPVVDAAIVSQIFWPILQKEQLKSHPKIQSKLDQFSIEYAKLKNPRRLVWMKQLGIVQLEVEIYEEDEINGTLTSHVREVNCTPAHATLLAHFEDKRRWTSEELSIVTTMPEEMVRKRMGFWVNQQVVQVSRSCSELVYSLVSVHHANGSHDDHHGDDDDEQQQAVSIGAHEEEEIKVYESYIVGMLSNLGQLPLERIHTMLKTFVAGSDHKYDKTPQQLSAFLQRLCKEEKLECSPDGLYKLLKKRS